MTWITAEEVSEEGYYWCRITPCDTQPTIVKIEISTDDKWVHEFHSSDEISIRHYGGTWQFSKLEPPRANLGSFVVNGYFCFELDEKSSNALKELATLPNVVCHHVTLIYRPTREEAEQWHTLVGNSYSCIGYSIAQDEKCQAIRVTAPSTNLHPHVTMSLADGVEAVYSNSLLQCSSTAEEKRANVELSGTIKYVEL